MPVSLIGVSGSVAVRPCDVAARLFHVGGVAFVRHVGLASEAQMFRSTGSMRERIRIIDMGPPFHIIRDLQVNLVGSVELEESELNDISDFITRRHTLFEKTKVPEDFPFEDAPELYQYIVCPHYEAPVKDRPGGRFSCSGFVYEAYQKAEICLVDIVRLPAIAFDELVHVYPELGEMRDRQDTARLDWLGLDGSGPWSILLPGYIMASLRRSAADIRASPHVARPEEIAFTQ